MREIYLIPSYRCNLHCPHCTIHKRISDEISMENYVKVLDSLDTNPQTQYIIFGGEPLINPNIDILIKHLANKNAGCTSNLVHYDERIIDLLFDSGIGISTSWNPHRFTTQQYEAWLKNCDKVKRKFNYDLFILITLTEDLISWDIQEFIEFIKNWGSNIILKFEYLVDPTKEQPFYDECNRWLCSLYYTELRDKIDNFKKTTRFFPQDRCRGVYTLPPNGVLKEGCPNYIKRYDKVQCLTCPLIDFCTGGCATQKCCILSKELYELINKGN